MAADIVVVGGGVIGLSVAYRLACEGVSVTLLDRREVGREASWAGAGLIPAHTERLDTSPAVALRSWSAVLYPEWSARLLEETGIDNGFRRTGGVDVGWSEAEVAELRTMAGRWRVERIVFERLAEADIRHVEPALDPSIRDAYFLPDRAQIRNPRHLRALRTAAEAKGATILEGKPVTAFETDGSRVAAVWSEATRIACGAAVVTAGAWSESLVKTLGVSAPTPPLKGQMVLLRSGDGGPRRIVEYGANYLVPRGDGRVLAGATQEEAGFDQRPTTAGVRGLLDLALKLCPGLADAELEASWAGLRPGSLDGRPYIGRLPGYANAFLAAGHKRAGLQLSTGTAEAVCDLVLGRPPRLDLSGFEVGRPAQPPDVEVFRS